MDAMYISTMASLLPVSGSFSPSGLFTIVSTGVLSASVSLYMNQALFSSCVST